MILQLLWKEAREHQGKILALLAILILPLLAIHQQWIASSTDTMIGVLLLASWIAPIWLAAWTATSERFPRTQATLAALPIHPWKIFAVKSAWGALTFLFPTGFMLALLATTITQGENDHPVAFSLAILLSSLNLYLLILAITHGFRREAFAAVVGVLVALACGLSGVLVNDFAALEPLRPAFLLGNPFAPLFEAFEPNRFHPMPLVHLATAALWWLIAAWRYARITDGRARHRAPIAPVQPTFLRTEPTRTPLASLIWREYREQRGVLIAAVLAAILIAFIAILLTWADSSGHPLTKLEYSNIFLTTLFFGGSFASALVAFILGIGALSRDLEPQLANFWRSRPIPLGPFFWTKYFIALAGVALLLAALSLTSLLAYQLIATIADLRGFSTDQYTTIDFHDALRSLLGQLFLLPLVLSCSMLFGILSRRTIYAGALSAMTLFAWFFIPTGSDHLFDYNFFAILFESRIDLPYFLVAFLTLLLTLALTLLARLAFHRNWRLG